MEFKMNENDPKYLEKAYEYLFKGGYILELKEKIAEVIGWEKLKTEVISRSKHFESKDRDLAANEQISVMQQLAKELNITIPSIQEYCETQRKSASTEEN